MRTFVLLMSLLLTCSVYAESLRCRDRNNFMSSWYELHLEKESTQISGKLVFITNQGFKVLQKFNLDLVESTGHGHRFIGDQVILNWRNGSVINFIDFETHALEKVFKEGFKCPLADMLFQRSSWGNVEAFQFFNSLNLPIKESNGGFREIRKYKEIKTIDESFSLYASEIGASNFAYTVKLNLNSKRLRVFQDESKMKVYFNDQDSKIIRELMGMRISIELERTKLEFNCDLDCTLTALN